MADTYTQALKARKIEPGAYDPDWSERFNEDVVDIFDAGINGQVEIDIGSNTTYTLAAMVNGTLSDSHYWRLNIVGTPASAVTFTIPASVTPHKEYLIDNQTGQALTVKYAATAGVTVQDGNLIRVLCDGTTVTESPATPRHDKTAAENTASVTPTNYTYPELDSRRYGDNTAPGTTDMTTALSNWINVLNVDGYLADQSFREAYLAPGAYLITGALPKITNSKVRIRGGGEDVSRIIAGGSTTYTAIQCGLDLPTSTPTEVHVSGIGLFYAGTGTRTLLKVNYAQYSTFEDILLHGAAVGLDLAGHQQVRFSNLRIQAVNPIILRTPTTAADGLDHTIFHDLELQSTDNTQPLVKCIGTMSLSNVVFTGNQGWLGGSKGFEYIGDSVTGLANLDKVVFENIRREETTAGSAGSFFDIQPFSTDACNSITWRNCLTGIDASTMTGWNLSKVRRPTFEDCGTSGGSITVAWTAIDATYEMVTQNCFFSTMSLTNAEKVIGSADAVLASGNEVRTCVYQWTGEGDTTYESKRGAIIYGLRVWGEKYTLADDAQQTLSGAASVAEALIEAVSSAGTGSSEWGQWSASNGVVTKRAGSTNTIGTDTDANLCVFAASGFLIVKNRLGESRDVLVKVTWA